MMKFFTTLTFLSFILLASYTSIVAGILREYQFNVEPEWIAPDGYWREAYTINGQTPGPLIEAEYGDTIRVLVVNNLNVPITFHWHGIHQSKTPWMDGVPGVTQWPILPKDRFTYEFKVEQYGSYWYHSHTIGTYDDGIRGPMLLHPNSTTQRPWNLITNSSSEEQSMESAFQRALNFQVYGWTHEMADSGLVQWKSSANLPICFDSILVNGFGRVQCPSPNVLQAQGAAAPGIAAFASNADVKGCMRLLLRNVTQENPVRCDATHSPHPVWISSKYSSPNGLFMVMHLINVGTDATHAISIDGHSMHVIMADGQFVEPQLVQAVKVHVGSRVSVLIALDQGDGDYTIRAAVHEEHQFQIQCWYGILRVDSTGGGAQDSSRRSVVQRQRNGLGSRAVVRRQATSEADESVSTDQIESDNVNVSNTTQLIKDRDDRPDTFVDEVPSNVKGTSWMQYNGSLINGAKESNESAFAPFPSKPPPLGPANVTIKASIANTPLAWHISDREYKGLYTFQEPLLFRSASERGVSSYLGTVFDVQLGDIVDLIFYTAVPVDHPLHKHHLPMWVIAKGQLVNETLPWNDTMQGLAQSPQDFNMNNPPLRDTVYMPGGSYVVMRYKVEFPSTTILHCHVQLHQSSGMAILIREAIDQLHTSHIPARIRKAAHVPSVMTNASSTAGLDTA